MESEQLNTAHHISFASKVLFVCILLISTTSSLLICQTPSIMITALKINKFPQQAKKVFQFLRVGCN